MFLACLGTAEMAIPTYSILIPYQASSLIAESISLTEEGGTATQKKIV